MTTLNLAMALEAMGHGADYFGSTTGNDKKTFEALRWIEGVNPPAWRDVQAINDEQIVPVMRANSIEGLKHYAEHARLHFITPGSGKAMVYQAKLEEARRYESDDQRDDDKYPLIMARRNVTGQTAQEVVGEWLSKALAWAKIAAEIEAIEDEGTIQIGKAPAAAIDDVAQSYKDRLKEIIKQ